MAEYLILIYADEKHMAAMDNQSTERVLAEHKRFVTEHAGVLRGGNRLRTSETATSIRREPGGELLVTDAPFAETKEVLGGYYLIESPIWTRRSRWPRRCRHPPAASRSARYGRAISRTEELMPVEAAVATAVAEAHRHEWAQVLATTVRVTGDIDLAEECVQDAYAKALATWATGGIPVQPGAWLTTVARRRALDLARRHDTQKRNLPLLVQETAMPGTDGLDSPEIVDDRLRLIFTCCHPALATEAQVALTLRLVCGLSTVEVARAFLVSESTMAARITRAKKKIAQAHIPYRVPPLEELPARVDAVLTVVHLLFTIGHTAPVGADLVRRDLVERSLDLARMLRTLLTDDADVAGMLGLILLTDARRPSRVGEGGELVLMADQDQARWGRSGRFPRSPRPRRRGAPGLRGSDPAQRERRRA
jgi:RNA polymerase sigma factor (sigma-70 family)